jgi:hypothetical protein
VRQFVYPVLDLNNRIWQQMLDVDCPIQQYLKPLAKNLKLPEELNYVLIPAGSNQPLDARFSLAQMRIPAGMQLFLRPVRDPLLKQLLDKLYDQAKDEVRDRLLDMARDKLKQLFDLDPYYPDPLHLKEQAWGQPVQPQMQQVQHPAVMQQLQAPVKAASKTGWIIAGVLGGGVVLIGGVITVAALVLIPLIRNALDKSTRSEPVLGTGDVQVTLRWDAPVDLDLHVIDPSGQEIWYMSPYSSTGGRLDVDANSQCLGMAASPVENVFWPYGGAPSGGYQVLVIYYMNCGYAGPVDYEVTVKQNDQVIDVLPGTVADQSESQLVTRFSR